MTLPGKGLVRLLGGAIHGLTSRISEPLSTLYLVGDGAAWVLDEEARSLAAVAARLGLRPVTLNRGEYRHLQRQIVHLTSQFDLGRIPAGLLKRNRVTVAYFHGRAHPDYPVFEECLDDLKRVQSHLSVIQVSCRSMRDYLAESGIEAGKLHVIPIAVDTDLFVQRGTEERSRVRRDLGISENAFVIGSFQKDGVGWGEGNEPKLIKGPDVFLEVMSELKAHFPNLHVLLSGPARGYVRNGLEQRGIPYTHRFFRDAREVAPLYAAVDVTLITSRDEGGPKAVLESMASGTPVVSTRVGQAADLVMHRENGWLTDIEDVPALASACEEISLLTTDQMIALTHRARATAERNSYLAQLDLWRRFWLDPAGRAHTASDQFVNAS